MLSLKTCSTCENPKTLDNFYKHKITKDGLQYDCKNCSNRKTKENKAINRRKVIEKYGGKCVCCGENNEEFLTFDHKNNDGAEHRKKTKTWSGGHFVYWLIRNNYPDFIEILCYNCNCSKGFRGYCPHELTSENHPFEQ